VSGFAEALPFVLRMEGGYADDPVDRGGATNRGVTQATYDAYRASQGLPPRPVREITDEEVEHVYHERYWTAAKCDALPWPASAVVFDSAVNHGVGRAARMLQEALGVKVDGIIGPVTLAAAGTADPHQLVNEMLWVRVDFYYRISNGDQVKFLRGWLRRLLHLRKEARAA
jgi:lysozyme family protein